MRVAIISANNKVLEVHLIAENKPEEKELENFQPGKVYIAQAPINAIEEDPVDGQVTRKVVRLIQ